MRLEQASVTLRRRAWKRPRALSFLHPFSKLRGPFVGPSGAILGLSTAALEFCELERDCIKFNVELDPKLRAWQERCWKRLVSQPSLIYVGWLLEETIAASWLSGMS
jgi:hypothetical protein